jgi:2-keto-4-pentenoate hydratase/2-oxohepta-3-ene-1,7-dioic acid hydratase in catechol pathway
VNGKVKQNSSTRFMIFKVPYLVSVISQVMTLLPGDVIATGTPPGIGPVQPGDIMTVTIAGIGSLTNPVK